MEEELNLDTLESDTEQKLKVKNRFEQLSEKVRTTSKERDTEIENRKKVESERDSALKEASFYKDFSSNISKYPEAANFQDKILEKVKGGYSTEDAMVSVLAKEGKLNPPSQPAQQPQIQAEGGSSATVIEGNKSFQDMTAKEKLEALREAEKSGDLIRTLRG